MNAINLEDPTENVITCIRLCLLVDAVAIHFALIFVKMLTSDAVLIIVAAVFSAAALTSSAVLISSHLLNMNEPIIQSKIVGILWMVSPDILLPFCSTCAMLSGIRVYVHVYI